MSGPIRKPEHLTVPAALAWIADAFAVDPSVLTVDTLRRDLSAWDSLGQVVLMSALDQDFSIKMTPAELASLVSIRDILAILQKHGRLRSS